MGAVQKGKARGLWHYLCKSCGRTFDAVTGTPLQGLHKKPRWLAFGESLAEGETVEASAQRCGIAHSTAFRWRHRFLDASRQDPETLRGIVEADETYLLRSRKGERNMVRPPRRRQKSEYAWAFQGSRAGPVRRGPVGHDPRGGAGLDAGGGNRGRAPSGRGEGCRAGRRRGGLLPALRAVARVVPRRSEPIRRTANPGSLPHPDGRQPAKPLKEIPVPLPRRRDEISRKLPSVMPTRLPRRKRRRVNLPRSRRQFAMHTNRKMSQEKWLSAVPPLRANRSDRAGFRPISCSKSKCLSVFSSTLG